MAVRHSDSIAPPARKGGRSDTARDKDEVEVMHSRLEPSAPLELDDNEFGGDPYNSTGRFSALIEKKKGGG